MFDSKAFVKYLATSQDEEPTAAKSSAPPSLEVHDKRFHPGGFKEGQTCKFREAMAKGDAVDLIDAAEKAELADMKADLASRADIVSKVIPSVAGQVGCSVLSDSLSVEPSTQWNPDTNGEDMTGGLRINAAVKGGKKEAEALLDGLSDMLGISRKKTDIFGEDGMFRISTFATPDETAGILDKMEGLKKSAQKAAEGEAKKKADEAAAAEKRKALAMATYAVTAAAKSVNFHADQGDFAPNMMKVNGAMMAKKDVEALLKDGLDGKDLDQANALLKTCGEIEDSVFKGKHGKVSQVPQMDVLKQKPKPEPKKPSSPDGQSALGTSLPPGIKDIRDGIMWAARTINYHVDQGDFKPNGDKLNLFKSAAKKLHEICPDGKSDNPYLQHLCDRAGEIAKSAKNGFKDKIGIVDKLPDGAVGGVKIHDDTGEQHASKPATTKGKGFDTDPERWASQAVGDSSPDYLRKKADALTFKEAASYLEKRGFPAVHDWKDLVSKHGFPEHYAKKVTCKHTPLKDQKMYEDSVKCAAAQLQELEERFPNMKKCHLACLFPSIPKGENVGAEWVKGDESNAKFSSICFHADYGNVWFGGQYSYGHPDSRLPFDVFRHEVMHGISTGAVADKWKAFVADTYGYPAKGFFEMMGEKVSGYASKPKDIYESEAETFAKITSRDYVPGTLPRAIEDFFYGEVLGCEPSKKHLMFDPDTLKNKPKSTQAAKSETVEMDDIASWFAPSPTPAKQQEKAKSEPVKVPQFAFA